MQLLFLREIQAPLEIWAAKEKKDPKVIQDREEFQERVGPEGKLELWESQVCFVGEWW